MENGLDDLALPAHVGERRAFAVGRWWGTEEVGSKYDGEVRARHLIEGLEGLDSSWQWDGRASGDGGAKGQREGEGRRL
jgi:hypothetical protein